ncbi:MAG: hypothetical protein OEW48_16995 [Phycisphaerae bacterium]|nr:hypothetical protein [Phycisphaerae bacterium]
MLKTLSLYRDFVDFLRKEANVAPKYAKIGNLILTYKLINTPELSAESKLTYAYLFYHRDDVTGFRVPVLSEKLGMAPELIRSNLKELQITKHIALITAIRNDDMSQLSYFYKIVDPTKYGMLDLEKEQFTTVKK